MKKTATAAPQPNPPQNREEMEDLVRDLCMLKINADELQNDLAREKHDLMARYEDRIKSINVRIAEMEELARQWAEANPAEFATKKSVVLVHGVVGWRKGMPSLKTLKGWKWDRVLNVLKVAFPEYVRVKEEVAKNVILDQRDTIGDDRLKRMGVYVDQSPEFFVEPHKQPKVLS